MKTARNLLFLGTATIAALIGCASKQSNDIASNPDLKGNMVALSTTLQSLYPMLVSERRFADTKNRRTIERNIETLGELSHALDSKQTNKNLAGQDVDPMVLAISKGLSRDLRNSLEGFRNGQFEYSRVVLKSTTNRCLQCHTRGNYGPQLKGFTASKGFAKLNDFERAELLTATRQFDLALKTYLNILSERKNAVENLFKWENAAQHALNIAVRVKDDPKTAKKISQKVIATPGVATFLKDDAQVWLKAISTWEKQKAKQKTLNKPVKTAEKLIKQGYLKEAYSGDTAALVHYLRATSILHNYVRKQGAKTPAKAYFLLGQAYDALQWDGLEMASDHYYKACVNRKPKSALALSCYRRLEENVYAGLSNIMSSNIPSEVRAELKSLYEIARPK